MSVEDKVVLIPVKASDYELIKLYCGRAGGTAADMITDYVAWLAEKGRKADIINRRNPKAMHGRLGTYQAMGMPAPTFCESALCSPWEEGVGKIHTVQPADHLTIYDDQNKVVFEGFVNDEMYRNHIQYFEKEYEAALVKRVDRNMVKVALKPGVSSDLGSAQGMGAIQLVALPDGTFQAVDHAGRPEADVVKLLERCPDVEKVEIV